MTINKTLGVCAAAFSMALTLSNTSIAEENQIKTTVPIGYGDLDLLNFVRPTSPEFISSYLQYRSEHKFFQSITPANISNLSLQLFEEIQTPLREDPTLTFKGVTMAALIPSTHRLYVNSLSCNLVNKGVYEPIRDAASTVPDFDLSELESAEKFCEDKYSADYKVNSLEYIFTLLPPITAHIINGIRNRQNSDEDIQKNVDEDSYRFIVTDEYIYDFAG